MGVYFVQGKGWRYDFTHKGIRHTQAGFKRKAEAKQAEAQRREAIAHPQPEKQKKIPTGMAFLELVNKRLDYVKAYHSEKHYTDYKSLANRWIKKWGKLSCGDITTDMIQTYLISRSNLLLLLP